MIDLGAPASITFEVRDDAGNLANAETVTLTITLPDGTTVTPVVTNPPAVTGKYNYKYPTVQSGRHIVGAVWQNPPGAYTDVFDVAPAVIPSIVSLADAKQFLGIDSDDTSEDDELRAWLAGGTEAIEREKNEIIARRQFTYTERNEHNHVLRLWHVPVISLDSLASSDGLRTWDVAADVRIDKDSGLVRVINGPGLRGWLDIAVTAGCQVVPYNYQQGMLVLLQHLWETQRGPAMIGGGVIGPEEAADYKQMYMLPRKVREWLGPPRPSVI